MRTEVAKREVRGVAKKAYKRTEGTAVHVLSRHPTDKPNGMDITHEILTTVAVVLVAMVPLSKPRPRRILDIVELATKSTLLACIALAAIGYFDYTYRLPRITLIVGGTLLFVILPAWFVAIRRTPSDDGERTVIVGDDPECMDDILRAVEGTVVGYICPPSMFFGEDEPRIATPEIADGGVPNDLDELACLGGLSRLDEVFVEYDVDTAVMAFSQSDRAEFFGALDSCYHHGVAAKVHRDHADVVLTTEASGKLVDIDLEPWDWQDHIVKRGFDLAFALVGIVAFVPVSVLIALAVKLEDSGPILYGQERTATFGNTFTIYKFRSMVPDAEQDGAILSQEDAGAEDPRVTRIGRVLRQTHLDEIPQLWSVFVGDMSVVGPRPERPELDTDMEADVGQWRSRWFVKPGLTGLAQINGATGFDPAEKLRYDVEYIREQDFWFDLKIVVRQMWMVVGDALMTAFGSDELGD
jgi:lipopolysaccharide/colanic/teichoic acid biosynthesis glycosyltransferase